MLQDGESGRCLLYTSTKAVTADGKMVIDYYYERHLYNVTLNAGTEMCIRDRDIVILQIVKQI